MANTSRPQGFRPFGKLLSVRPYKAAGAIYPGDPVKADGGAANTSDLQMRVAVAAAADALLGVAMTYASGAGVEVLVADDPSQLFMAESDDATIDQNTDLGLNYDFVAASPDTTYKRSRAVIDASTQATTATLPFKVVQVLRAVKDSDIGSKCKVVCKINNHQLGSHTGTAGV